MKSGSGDSNFPLISVIVPTYNYGHVLQETLENLRHQTIPDWECIIVDDGSTDNTAEIAKSWERRDPRYRYIYQANAGLSAARNTGIAASRGLYIQLLDADDMLMKEKFARQLEVFETNEQVEIVYGEVRYFTSEDHQARFMDMACSQNAWMPCSSSDDQVGLIKDLFRINLFAVNCPLIKREVFDKVGFFDVHLRSVEDWDYWCRCAFAGVYFQFDPYPGAYALVRTHGGSMSRNKATMLEAARTVRYKIMHLIRVYPDHKTRQELFELNRNQTAHTIKLLAEHYLAAGRKGLFLKRLFEFARIRGEYRYFIKETMRLLG